MRFISAYSRARYICNDEFEINRRNLKQLLLTTQTLTTTIITKNSDTGANVTITQKRHSEDGKKYDEYHKYPDERNLEYLTHL